jgi:hypothetical protein
MSRNCYLEYSCVRNGGLEIGCVEIGSLEIVADGRFFGLSAGDWTVLLGGFGLSALAVFLL